MPDAPTRRTLTIPSDLKKALEKERQEEDRRSERRTSEHTLILQLLREALTARSK